MHAENAPWRYSCQGRESSQLHSGSFRSYTSMCRVRKGSIEMRNSKHSRSQLSLQHLASPQLVEKECYRKVEWATASWLKLGTVVVRSLVVGVIDGHRRHPPSIFRHLPHASGHFASTISCHFFAAHLEISLERTLAHNG